MACAQASETMWGRSLGILASIRQPEVRIFPPPPRTEVSALRRRHPPKNEGRIIPRTELKPGLDERTCRRLTDKTPADEPDIGYRSNTAPPNPPSALRSSCRNCHPFWMPHSRPATAFIGFPAFLVAIRVQAHDACSSAAQLPRSRSCASAVRVLGSDSS